MPATTCTATAEETEWALAIRKAMSQEENFSTNLSDFELLQHAIVAKEKTHKAMARIRRLQAWKETHGVVGDGSAEEGKKAVRAMLELQPRVCLMVGKTAITDRHVMALCGREYDPQRMKENNSNNRDEHYQTWCRGTFYMLQACQSSLDAMRNGVIFWMDAEGVGWKHMDLKVHRDSANLYASAYPMRMKEMALVEGNALIRVFFGMVKVFLSSKIRQLVAFPATKEEFVHGTHKDDFAGIVPEVLGGDSTVDSMLAFLDQGLDERYERMSRYRLDGSPS